MQEAVADAAARAAVGRREQRKARNRAKILRAAARVFAEKGFGAATVRDIVRETDLAAGTFYNYFGDKEQAFRALLEDFAAKARAAARAERRRPVPVEERVAGAYRSYFQLIVDERLLWAVMRRNAGVVAMMTGEALFEAAVRELIEDLREWTDAGDLPHVDLDLLATAGAAIGGQVAAVVAERHPPDVEGAARFCARMFVGGVAALADSGQRR